MVVRRCLKGNLPPKWPDNFGKFEVFFFEVSDPQIKDAWGLQYLFCVGALLQKKGWKQASGWIDCQFVLGKRGNTSQLNQCYTVDLRFGNFGRTFVKSALFDRKNHPQDFHPKIIDSLPSNSTSSASLKHPMTISTTFGMFSPLKRCKQWSSKSILPLAESIRSEVNGYEVLPNRWRWDPRSSSLMIARPTTGWASWVGVVCCMEQLQKWQMKSHKSRVFEEERLETSQPFAKIHVQVHSYTA